MSADLECRGCGATMVDDSDQLCSTCSFEATEPKPAFEWKGEALGTLGALVRGADKAEREGKAAEFLAAYRAYVPEHADANLGYLIGYMGDEDRTRMYEAYQLVHPIFGGAV